MQATKMFFVFLLLSLHFINAQVSITPKYSVVLNNEFSSKETSIELSYLVDKINLEIGFNFGFVNMVYNEHNWQTISGTGTEYKSFYGIQTYYYPLNILGNRLKPFIGCRIDFVSDKHFSFGTGGNHIMQSGYYYPSSTDDFIAASSIGTIFYFDAFNLILGFEYEYRKFIYGYDKYSLDTNMDILINEYKENKTLHTLLINIGIHFEF